MAIPSVAQVETRYRHLEPKPSKRWTKQLGLKGRNMLASHLVAVMRASGRTAEETAQDYGLPLEAVQEAVAYVEANEDWIKAENQAVSRGLALGR